MRAGSDLDAALVDATRRGDRTAFAQIIERYQRAVYAVSFASVRDHALSQDITQDTFVTAWSLLADLRDSARLPAWLCGIARNHARDARKRQRREHGEQAPELADPTTPFDALSDAESERLVATALEAVPEVYREPLVLFYFEQRSIEDVARALGISSATTNKRLSRGRQHLATRIEELLERKLGARGPKRDLVACVLAAIGVIGSASPADASTAPAKGSTMYKLALATILATTVGALGLQSASVASTPKPAPPRAATTAAASAAPAVSPRSRPSSSTPPASASRPRAAPPQQPSLPASPPATAVPDCAAAARHMAELTIEGFESQKPLPPRKREMFVTLRSRDLAKRCAAERWSDDRRICIVGTSDLDDARLGCRDGIIALDEELANLPAELQCDVVAQHVTRLMIAPDGKLGMFMAKLARDGRPVDARKITEEMHDKQREECERFPWSTALRRCVVASQTGAAMASCW